MVINRFEDRDLVVVNNCTFNSLIRSPILAYGYSNRNISKYSIGGFNCLTEFILPAGMTAYIDLLTDLRIN